MPPAMTPLRRTEKQKKIKMKEIAEFAHIKRRWQLSVKLLVQRLLLFIYGTYLL